eukprot:TRINITY_DN31875_c0_g1_i1.p1 TRINITY_DN31875_c0_g1~~TRINITY_DN31875_c0_g1_i1.p1  ORF type:complete len:460 (-),score=83.08 TRINITY_DN31875_c0_g1_i1:163-1503(-)
MVDGSLPQPTEKEEEWKEDCVGDSAYVAFLHGHRQQFLLYALLLGQRLKQLDSCRPRVLLVGRPLPDYPAPFLEGEPAKCLSAFWKVEPVDLVDASAADKTSLKRHRYVFTKLRALEVPYRKVLFLDLDVVIRRSPAELFDIPAPAGMYHGTWGNRMLATHGQPLPADVFERYNGCVNAGMLRLDPAEGGKIARRKQLDEMLREVSEITEKESSYLPEQYYIVQKLQGWHHIDVAWNCEVAPLVYVDPYIVSESASSKVQHAVMPWDWYELGSCQEDLAKAIGMFHFSGTFLEPWWYLHLTSDRAQALLRKQFQTRDARGMIALAVAEWLSSVAELRKSAMLGRQELEYVEELLSSLSSMVAWWWDQSTDACTVCGAVDCTAWNCDECTVREAMHPTHDVAGDRLPGSGFGSDKHKKPRRCLGAPKRSKQAKKAKLRLCWTCVAVT